MHKFILSIIAFLLSTFTAFSFTIVLDAGHGGHDAGAVGAFSKEKNLNLAEVLLVGKMLKEKNPDIKVIYTRSSDVFVDLNQRAKIANKAKADLFVSVHTNSSRNKSAKGMETFTLGISREKENMEVAMLENSVILLEDNYEKKYEGFDPNSTDSYIMFEFMQDQFMEHSIQLADGIQSRLISNSSRIDRGVRQAGFLVLRATAMPSVLIEIGFISNREEEKFLNNSTNQQKIAAAIYEGIIAYKNDFDKRNGIVPEVEPTVSDSIQTDSIAQNAATKPLEPISTAIDSTKSIVDSVQTAVKVVEEPSTPKQESILFYVQFLVSKNKYNANDAVFKNIKVTKTVTQNGMYKYYALGNANYNQVLNLKKSIADKFPGAFIVAFKGDTQIPVKQAIEQSK